MSQATSPSRHPAMSGHTNVSLTAAQASVWTGQSIEDIEDALATGELRSLAVHFVDRWGRWMASFQLANAGRTLVAV